VDENEDNTLGGKNKQEKIGAPPLTWMPWYKMFNNIYGVLYSIIFMTVFQRVLIRGFFYNIQRL